MSASGLISDVVVLDDYYHPQFHFCEPLGGPAKQPESLGSILFGDRIFNSPYDVRDPPILRPPVTHACFRFKCCKTMPRASLSV
jgi:hypothetical protein